MLTFVSIHTIRQLTFHFNVVLTTNESLDGVNGLPKGQLYLIGHVIHSMDPGREEDYLQPRCHVYVLQWTMEYKYRNSYVISKCLCGLLWENTQQYIT